MQVQENQQDTQEYDILDNKYNLIKKIGDGATASVKLAKEIGKDELLAIKMLKSNECKFRNPNLKHFNAEIENLKKVKHENIINLIDSGVGKVKKLNGLVKEKNYLVLEYAENCELFDYIYFAKKGFGEYLARGLFKQILLGLDACHKSGVAHRDLKTENIMMTDKWQVKIADFGYATNIDGKNEKGLLTTFLGTLSYASPEVICKKFYKGAPSDIFSAGVILYILVTGKLPFGKAAIQDSYYRSFIRKDTETFWKMITPKIDNMQLTNEFKSIINAIFSYDPEQRITIEDLLKHEWMQMEMPTEEELQKEFDSRKVEVQKLKELEQAEEEDGYGNTVYRSGDVEVEDTENSNREVREYAKTSNPYRVIVKNSNYSSIFKNALSFFRSENNEDEKTVQKDDKHYRFTVSCPLDKETKELIDENFTVDNLELQVEVKKLGEDESVVEWTKLRGDKMEFFELFQKFTESC